MAYALPISARLLLLAASLLLHSFSFCQLKEEEGLRLFQQLNTSFLEQDNFVLSGTIEAFAGKGNGRRKIDVQQFRYVSAGSLFNSSLGSVKVIGLNNRMVYIDEEEQVITVNILKGDAAGFAAAKKKVLIQIARIDTAAFREVHFSLTEKAQKKTLQVKSANGLIRYTFDPVNYRVSGIEMEGIDEELGTYTLVYQYSYSDILPGAFPTCLKPEDVVLFDGKKVIPIGRFAKFKAVLAP